MKKYILVGSNNFWFATNTSLKRIKEQAKDILSENPDLEMLDYQDPETGRHPLPPDILYLYEAEEINELFLDDYQNNIIKK